MIYEVIKNPFYKDISQNFDKSPIILPSKLIVR